MADGTCTVAGCTDPVKARAWCASHYRRWQVSGDVQAHVPLRRCRRGAVCSVEGCGRPHCVRGLCEMHARRVQRRGTTDLPEPKTPQEVFWSHVQRGSGCWEWLLSRYPDGYGAFGKGKERRAHRLAWEYTYGPIPAGMFVCHRCDNPPCCNPAHLFLGTVRDNSYDMLDKRRDRAVGDRHPQHKLSLDDVRFILASRETGVALAARFGVCASHISRIRRGRSWGRALTESA